MISPARNASVRRLPLAEPRHRQLPLASDARGIDRASRPVYAVWELTLRCDLSCRHCGSRAGHPRPAELSGDECVALVAELAELGVKEVTLIGGEAYLHPAWLRVIRAIAEHGMVATLTSGGRGLDAARARSAAEAGLSAAAISLDGTGRTHDELRGVHGAHRSALAALGHLRAVGVPVSANTQINRANQQELPELLDELIAAGIYSWQIALTVPMGRAADRPELLLQPYDLLELFPRLAALATRAREAGVRFQTGNNVGYFGPYEAALRQDFVCSYGGSCGAGFTTLGIESDGTVKGCPSLSSETFAAGNVRAAKLREIWERGLALQALRSRGTEQLWGFCRSCYYAAECGGGCTWTAAQSLGRPGNNPYCHHRALELAAQGLRERLNPLGPAPGVPFDAAPFELIVEPLQTG